MTNPPIYFTRENGKLALCLSNAAKWFGGILAALIIAGTGWFFSLVYTASENSRAALQEIRHINDKLDFYKADTNYRLMRLDDRINVNDDRDYKAHGK